MGNWDVNNLAIVFDYSETQDCERFALSSSDAGKIYSSGAFVALHPEGEVYVPLGHAYDAVYPRVPVEIPDWFGPNSISQQLISLRAVSEVLKDLLGDGAGQPLLIIRILYERDPSGDSERPEENQRRPSALDRG